ncbi:MAG: hypothetical protein U5P10_08190 [Spirochaetia bacterium]|nr:hypothetical protein [Spirochaetia bacterium]
MGRKYPDHRRRRAYRAVGFRPGLLGRHRVDLAIADYCGMTREEFWRGYGQPDFRRDRSAEVRRLFYLLYEHQKYIVISVSRRRSDPQGARRYADQSLQIMRRFKESGRVDI